MEKYFNWESKSGIWRVKARVVIDKTFFSDHDVFKLNKQTGHYERMNGAKKYTKEIETAREEAREFIRTAHAEFAMTAKDSM